MLSQSSPLSRALDMGLLHSELFTNKTNCFNQSQFPRPWAYSCDDGRVRDAYLRFVMCDAHLRCVMCDVHLRCLIVTCYFSQLLCVQILAS